MSTPVTELRGPDPELTFRPLTAERWADFEELFGARGACGGCWCMWWRLRRKDFVEGKGAGNREAMKRIVDSGEAPGIMAYSGGRPVAWCAVAPRASYTRLEGSRILKPVDDQAVWSVVCFFVSRPFRRRGVTPGLLRAAADYAASRGAKILEGYPQDPGSAQPDAFVYTGLVSAFRRAGFEEACRRSPKRPVMRRRLT